MMTFGTVLGTFDWNNDHLMIGNEHGAQDTNSKLY